MVTAAEREFARSSTRVDTLITNLDAEKFDNEQTALAKLKDINQGLAEIAGLAKKRPTPDRLEAVTLLQKGAQTKMLDAVDRGSLTPPEKDSLKKYITANFIFQKAHNAFPDSPTQVQIAKDALGQMKSLKASFGPMGQAAAERHIDDLQTHQDSFKEAASHADANELTILNMIPMLSGVVLSNFSPADQRYFADKIDILKKMVPVIRAGELTEAQQKEIKEDILPTIEADKEVYLEQSTPSSGLPPTEVAKNKAALFDLNKIEQVAYQLLHESRVNAVGGDSSPDREEFLRPHRARKEDEAGKYKNIADYIEMFVGAYGQQIDEIDAIGRTIASVDVSTDPEARRKRNFDPERRKIESLREQLQKFQEAQSLDQIEAYNAGIDITKTEKEDDLFNQYINDYIEWLTRLLTATEPLLAGTGTPLGSVVIRREGLPTSYEKPAWKKYLETDDGAALTVDQLEDLFIPMLLNELGKVRVNAHFQDTDNENRHKYEALTDYLTSHQRMTTDPAVKEEAARLANFISNRIGLFDYFNPYAKSGCMSSEEEEMGAGARPYNFDRPTLDYFLGYTNTKEAHKNYENADLLHYAMNLMEDYFMELPEPGFKKSGGQRDPAGNFKKGWFSFFAGNWMGENKERRDELMERLQVEMEAAGKFAGRRGLDTKEKKEQFIWLSIELAASLNIRTSLFVRTCYAVGESPPGGISDAKVIEAAKASCPLALELNNATKTVRLIPTIVEGGEVPQAFLDQMEAMLLAAARAQNQNEDEVFQRMRVLKRSIRASRWVSKLNGIIRNWIPGMRKEFTRFEVELKNLAGWTIHHDEYVGEEGDEIGAAEKKFIRIPGSHHMDATRIGKIKNAATGEKYTAREELLLLPSLFNDIYTGLRANNRTMTHESRTFADRENCRKKVAEFEHKIMEPLSFDGEPADMIQKMVVDLTTLLGYTSTIKIAESQVNLAEIGELFHRRICYYLRYFAYKGYNPTAELLIIGPFTGNYSLVTALRRALSEENQGVMKEGFAKDTFQYENPHSRRLRKRFQKQGTNPRGKNYDSRLDRRSADFDPMFVEYCKPQNDPEARKSIDMLEFLQSTVPAQGWPFWGRKSENYQFVNNTIEPTTEKLGMRKLARFMVWLLTKNSPQFKESYDGEKDSRHKNNTNTLQPRELKTEAARHESEKTHK